MPDGTTLLERVGPAVSGPPPLPHAFGRVIAAATIGTALEWFDFFLYGVVAPLVFDTLFFPKLDPVVGIIAVWGTFAAGFLARPLGGIFFGHFGDQLGRKWPVIQAVAIMGVASALIGCLPGYASIGIAAPLLLLLLRFVQGFALGGESIGAALLAIEWAPKEKRGFYGAFPQAAGPIGIITASLMVIPLSYFLGSGFTAWGWRLPFMASFVLMLVAAGLLLTVSDSMVFLRAKAEERVSKTPVTDVLRGYKKPWAIATAIAAGSSTFSYLVTIFAMGYGARTLHMSTGMLTTGFLLGNVVALFAMPAFGRVSDKLGRRPLWATGVILAMLYVSAVLFRPQHEELAVGRAGHHARRRFDPSAHVRAGRQHHPRAVQRPACGSAGPRSASKSGRCWAAVWHRCWRPRCWPGRTARSGRWMCTSSWWAPSR